MSDARWWLGALVAGALWLVSPTIALCCVRGRLSCHPQGTARDRWRTYDHWQLWLCRSSVAGFLLTLAAMSPSRTILVFSALGYLAWLTLGTVPVSLLLLLGAWIGIPLRRAALPEDRRQSSFQLALRALSRSLGNLLCAILFYWWFGFALAGPWPWPGAPAQLRLASMVIGAGWLVCLLLAAFAVRRPKAEPPPPFPAERRDEIDEEIRRLAHGLGVRPLSVRVETRNRSHNPDRITSPGHEVTVPGGIAGLLDPEQTAAVVVSYLATEKPNPQLSGADLAGCLTAMLVFAACGWLLTTLFRGTLTGPLAAGVLLLAVPTISLMVWSRRKKVERRVAVDARLSPLLSQPDRLLQALEMLERSECERLLPEQEGALRELQMRIRKLQNHLVSEPTRVVDSSLEAACE